MRTASSGVNCPLLAATLKPDFGLLAEMRYHAYLYFKLVNFNQSISQSNVTERSHSAQELCRCRLALAMTASASKLAKTLKLKGAGKVDNKALAAGTLTARTNLSSDSADNELNLEVCPRTGCTESSEWCLF